DGHEVTELVLRSPTLANLDPQGERSNVRNHHVAHRLVLGNQSCLDAGAHGHDLIRVETLAWLFLKEFGDQIDNGRHSRGTAHQNDLVNVRTSQAGVAQDATNGQLNSP